MNRILTFLALVVMATGAGATSIDDLVAQANLSLAGKGLRINTIESLGFADAGAQGRTLFFSNTGNKQLPSDWVPGDPRRTGLNDLFVLVDDVDVTRNSVPNNTLVAGVDDLNAYHAATATWNDVACSNIEIVDLGNSGGIDIGFVQFLFGFGGEAAIRADISHAGMLGGDFFDTIACGIPGSGCGANILGVTFTLVFVDDDGNPTDIDRNRKADTGIREIYYNENFPWQVNPNDVTFDGTIDLQSVALHEFGHGLSQGHFGKGFFIDRNHDGIVPGGPDEIVTAPTAIMNAAHTVAHREISGTDLGGHCSNWAQWPNR